MPSWLWGTVAAVAIVGSVVKDNNGEANILLVKPVLDHHKRWEVEGCC